MKLQPNFFKRQTVESLNHTIEIYTLTPLLNPGWEKASYLFMEFDMFVPKDPEEDLIRVIYSIRFNSGISDFIKYYTREHTGTQESAFAEIMMLAETELDAMENDLELRDMQTVTD